MTVDGVTIAVLVVLFLATLIRSTFGFGEALIAVPLLALLIPVEVAVPLVVLASITVATVVVVQDRHQVQFSSAWRLVLSTLFGIPLGLLLLTRGPSTPSKLPWRSSSLRSPLTAWSAAGRSSCGTIGWHGSSGLAPGCWAGPTG